MRQRLGLFAMPLPDQGLLAHFVCIAQFCGLRFFGAQGSTDNLIAQYPPKIGGDMLAKIIDPSAGVFVGTGHLQYHGVALRCSSEVNLSP